MQRQTEPLRPLSAAERRALEQIARAGSERVDRVARAKARLAVAAGQRFTAAARAAGRRSGDAVAHLVSRFTTEGRAALEPRHAGGPPVVYDATVRERILRAFRRPPDRELDGTATWSLTTLQRALRRAPDGLPTVSPWTILQTLHDAGYTWQRDRTWCHTGTVVRKRKAGAVAVTDPDATPQKTGSSRRTGSGSNAAWRCGRRTRRGPTRPCRRPGPPGRPKGSRPAGRTSTCAAAPPSG